ELDLSTPTGSADTRGIFTVQPRPMQKVERLAATAYIGTIPNNIFEQYFPVGVRLNYYILENLGVELAGSYAVRSDPGLTETIEDPRGVGADGVLLGDRQISHFNFGLTWSPFFGKTSFLNQGVSYFDAFVFAGVGAVVKESQVDFGTPANTGISPEGVLGLGLMYLLSQDISVRVDFRQYIFQSVRGGTATPSEVSLGFTYFVF
ncbi:MAG: outer membrane beta-barrel domain-containing protein, partial [Myxococcota bacterium]